MDELAPKRRRCSLCNTPGCRADRCPNGQPAAVPKPARTLPTLAEHIDGLQARARALRVEIDEYMKVRDHCAARIADDQDALQATLLELAKLDTVQRAAEYERMFNTFGETGEPDGQS